MTTGFLFWNQELAAQGVIWSHEPSWSSIRTKAKSENKFIFVDAYATWCAPCQKMDKDIFPEAKVGQIMNSQFISVRVQMDSTSADNESIRSWYPVARFLNTQYVPDGYPCFLFFSPDGKLVSKGLGFKTADEFIDLAIEALRDPVGNYEANLSKFKNNELPYSLMPTLAMQAYRNGNKAIAEKIAKAYKSGVMDKSAMQDIITKDNLLLLAYFSQLIEPKDRYFNIFYNYEGFADSIINEGENDKYGKIASRVTLAVVNNSEVLARIYKGGKPIPNVTPDWDAIKRRIHRRYNGRFDTENLVINAKVSYYSKTSEWSKYIGALVEKVEHYGLPSLGLVPANIISSAFAFHCEDSTLLSKAAEWVELSILESFRRQGYESMVELHRDSVLFSGNNDFSNLAAILYKAGRRVEAIKWVEWHIRLIEAESKNVNDGSLKSKNEILKRMKEGKPIDKTWDPSWFY